MPKHSIAYPPRVSLAQVPTPMHRLDRISRRMGVDIFIKRDDLTGMALSGNKIRKLEFVLARALEMGCETVITCGGAQSNHARATAVATTRLGLKSLLFLRTEDPQNPPPVSGNILLDRMAGARIEWITPDAYRDRDTLMAEAADSLKDRNQNAYVIPEGASDAVGAWGYVGAFEELAGNIAALGSGKDGSTTIVHATGSGGTCAGLLIGAALLDSDLRIATVNVCDDRDYFTEVIGGIYPHIASTMTAGGRQDFCSFFVQ
ncbi:MAG: 1-aminocyclopropane-1-carboxylate deaminase/D-cysteine desulfhydrase [Thermodesulfobacteriota bacterium]